MFYKHQLIIKSLVEFGNIKVYLFITLMIVNGAFQVLRKQVKGGGSLKILRQY